MNEPAQAPPDQYLGSTIKGCYYLERLLGAGGMGAVYEAVDAAGQRFALKLVHSHIASEQAAARFLREAQVGGQINSNHVVPVVDSGEEPGGQLFLVMPMLSGYDVAGLLERYGAIHPVIAVRIVLQTCAGLEAAHRTGVIHRDIKPSNLFLDHRSDGEVIVRICDFGVAKRTEMYDDSHLTRTGASMGSPLYMSPEQMLSSKHVDERTDVYSLAATLYELLCGTTPHGDAASLSDLLVRICTRNPPGIQDRAPWIHPELALVLHRGLHRHADCRFESIAEFAAALLPFCDGDRRLHAQHFQPLGPDLTEHVAPRADLSQVTAPEGQAMGLPGERAVEDDPLLGQRVGGRYHLLRLLGRGGMGNVYEAETPDGVRVAVKVISPELAAEGSDTQRRFLREARAAMSIDSPHVVKTLDAGNEESEQLPYIVMELMRGVDLSALLKRQGPMDPTVVVRSIIQAGYGIAAAHAQGIVHRDIKPANIFLSVQPGQTDVMVKVCDFGVAKRLSVDGSGSETTAAELTQTGGILGSPAYMSPEQAQSARTVDGRTDIWSLGIALYEGLSGRQPWYQCESLGQIIVAICTAPVPWIQDIAPWVDPGLAEIVHGALQRDPSQRWQTIDDFIRALQPYAHGDLSVSRNDMRGLDAAQRSQLASRSPRSEAQGSFNAASTTAGSVARTAPGTRRSSALTAVVLITILLVVGGIGAGVAYRFANRPDAPPALAAPAPTSEVIEGVSVTIQPADATVSVDGKPAQTKDGKLVFDGRPGDSFQVEVAKGDERRSVVVVITRDGKASPPVIEIKEKTPTAVPVDAGSETADVQAPLVPPPAARPATRPAPPPVRQPVVRQPAPAAPAAPPASPPRVGPVDEW